ncbi:MAG: ABC transporter permease [Rhodospirillaceae bacterium]|nr:MAG: ABC transporter permease [Rhodospirillaceae bacterium]
MADVAGQRAPERGGRFGVDGARDFLTGMGQRAVAGIAEFGFGAVLLGQVVYWIAMGRRQEQPVRIVATFERCMEVGVRAIPIISMMSVTIGIMLAIQGIYSLKIFGAEDQVVIGLGFAVVREFGPLITGILVAGRTGSSLAARIGTMRISQEIDALQVMGIEPVRFVVAPALIAMTIMVPVLAFWADLVMLAGAGWYVRIELGISLGAYVDQLTSLVRVEDVMHGLYKSVLFGILITLVGVINGANVEGGAEGVGRMTTRSVVLSISAIIVTDMIFTYITTR